MNNYEKEIESLTKQLELVKRILKTNQAVAVSDKQILIQELGEQRKYIGHLEMRCSQSGVQIFVEDESIYAKARNEVQGESGETLSGKMSPLPGVPDSAIRHT